MLVKSMLVPLVDATAVPDVITLDAIELTTAPVIVGLVNVGLVPNTTAPEPVDDAKEVLFTVPCPGVITCVIGLV